MNKNSPKEMFNNYALKYQDKFMDFDLYHDTFDFLCNAIEINNAKILEIGCGPGNITKYLASKRPDFKIQGIDIAPKMIALAKKNLPSAEFKIMDCKNILSLNSKFNAIICGFTLPYLNKEEVLKLIQDISKLINDNGILYISTMEDDYEKSKYISSSIDKDSGLFTYYHQEYFLTNELEKNGFNIIKTQHKDYPEPKDDSKDLIIIAKKLA